MLFPTSCNHFWVSSSEPLCAMFKIEVFDALQTWFGPSKYTSLKTNLQNATLNWKWRRHLKFFLKQYSHHKNHQVQGIVNTRSRVRWLFLNFAHYIGNMYRLIHASFVFQFYILGLMSWILWDPVNARNSGLTAKLDFKGEITCLF